LDSGVASNGSRLLRSFSIADDFGAKLLYESEKQPGGEGGQRRKYQGQDDDREDNAPITKRIAYFAPGYQQGHVNVITAEAPWTTYTDHSLSPVTMFK
jgi:hypothetical protein